MQREINVKQILLRQGIPEKTDFCVKAVEFSIEGFELFGAVRLEDFDSGSGGERDEVRLVAARLGAGMRRSASSRENASAPSRPKPPGKR